MPEDIDISDPAICEIVRTRMESETPQFMEHMHKLKAEFELRKKGTK
jgi:hypothetical protein